MTSSNQAPTTPDSLRITRRLKTVGAIAVTLNPIDLDDEIITSLNSVLRVLGSRTNFTWRVEPTQDALVHITQASSMFANTMLQPNSGTQTQPLVIVIYDNEDIKPDTPFALFRPFRVMPVLEVMERLSAAISGNAQPVEQSTSAPRSPAGEFATALKQCCEEKFNPYSLTGTYDDGSTLLAEPEAAVFFADAGAVAHLKAGRLPSRSARIDGPADGGKIGSARPITELTFATGLASANGSLPAHSPGAVYAMNRWPPLSLNRSVELLKLCAELTHRPCSVDGLARATGVNLATSEHFITACLYGGYARIDHVPPPGPVNIDPTEPPVSAPVKNTKVRQLIHGLRARFGL